MRLSPGEGKVRERLSKDPRAFEKARKQSFLRISEASKDAAHSLFAAYKRRSTLSGADEDCAAAAARSEELSEEARQQEQQNIRLFRKGLVKQNGKLTKEVMRGLLPEVSDELYEFLWTLFDVKQTGAVSSDEFVMAMAMLSSATETVEDQITAAFHMFDTEKNGALTRAEFETMIKVTVNLSLERLLNTEQGAHAFEEVLEKEYSVENLTFWRHCRDFSHAADEERHEFAHHVYDTFVREGAEQQVNLSSTQVKRLSSAMAALTEDVPADLFLDAEQEIFTLMERDTFKRFRDDATAVQTLVDEFFKGVTLTPEGKVSFETFFDWAMDHMEVLVFFASLTAAIKRVLAKQKADVRETRDNLAASVRDRATTFNRSASNLSVSGEDGREALPSGGASASGQEDPACAAASPAVVDAGAGCGMGPFGEGGAAGAAPAEEGNGGGAAGSG